MHPLREYEGYSTAKIAIESAQAPQEIKGARGVVDHVLEGLHLGNDEKFVETLGHTFTCKTGKGALLDTSNPHNFEVTISSCSWKRVVRAMPDLEAYSQKQVEKSLAERKITWLQIGGSVPDDKHAWTDMVYNATFPHSDFTKIDLEIPRSHDKQTAEQLAHRQTKKLEVEKIPVNHWFASTFSILDEAIVKGKKTLVHCHAGASRSPALLAAYLINRFDVSAEQAIAFLRTKRAIANPKCIDSLKAYHAALQQLQSLN